MPSLINGCENGSIVIRNEITSDQLNRISKNKAHISVWRQKTRLRVYVNEEKILDIPRAFSSNEKFSYFIFELPSDMSNANDRYFISNIKLAIGAPDTRHKLIEVGKFSTTGIKFD
ncbi:MAG: OmpA family protein, partial [Brevinematales bacterium]